MWRKHDRFGCQGLLWRAVFVFCVLAVLGATSTEAADRVVKVGVYENAPKVFTDPSGKPAGVFVDILEFIAAAEGWDLHYVPGTWGEGLDRLQRGEIDLMPDVAHTADREKRFAFHGVPVLSSWYQIYARKGSGIQSILDLAGKRIVVLERSVQQESFARLAEGFGLNAVLIALPDYRTLFEQVAQGKADAAITNRFYGMMHAKKFNLEDTSVIFNPSNLFFAAPPGTRGDLLRAIDARLAALKQDPQSIYYQSLKRWTSEQMPFKLPAWIPTLALAVGVALLLSLGGSLVLKRQVNARTRDLRRTNRALQIASEVSQALVRSGDEAGLLEAICRILVGTGGYRLAWIVFAEAGGPEAIRLEALAGDGDGGPAPGTAAGSDAAPWRGLAGGVLQNGQPCFARHIATDAGMESWRDHALQHGYASAAALPLRVEQETIGAIGLCAAEPDAFDTQEVAQLTELCDDVAFGIASHRTRVARKLAEAQRREAQQRFVDIVEFLPDATFVVDREKRVIAWNQACEAMTGVKKNDMLGRTDYAYAEPFFGQRRPALIDLLDMPAAEAETAHPYARRQGDRVFAEIFLPHLRGGRGGHVWAVASPLYDQGGRRYGAIESLRDISEHKAVEDHLRASEQKYRELVMLANSIILRFSRDGRITFLNEFGQRFFGYTESEIIGRSVLETIVPDQESSGRDLRHMMEEIFADPQRFEHNINENIRRNGERVWIDWRNRMVLDAQGRIQEILSIGSDITERKLADEQIRRLNEELRRNAEVLERRVAERTAELAAAMEKARAADHLKSAFLATMSHELRTPLNSIIGFTGILLQGLAGPLNQEQKKQLGMVQASSRHLLDLINDVLDISKIEAGQLSLSPTPFALRDAVEKMYRLVEPLAAKKGVGLKLEAAEEVAGVTADRRRLEQVLLNLFNNAVKFTEQGEVRVACRTDGDHYLISVSDTGIGIRPEEIEGLFQPFHQIDTGLSRRHEGTGLGLSICKKLIDLMGGAIEVRSQYGRGSTFSIRIPGAGCKTPDQVPG